MPGRKPNSQEKNRILSLQLPSSSKQVTGIQVLQKFEEPNRIVLVKADMMPLTSEALKFRDLSWTIITRSESDPQHASVVRVYKEIFMDPHAARPEHVAYAQNTVLKYLSWKLHECSHKLQDTLTNQCHRRVEPSSATSQLQLIT
jgi:hypothetical protein